MKIVISSKTWSRDSHNLFDYECVLVNKQEYTTEASCEILRTGNDVDFSETFEANSESRLIARLQQRTLGYTVNSANGEDLWLVVKSVFSGYELKPDVVLKLGRVKLRVKRMKFSNFEVFRPEDLKVEETGTCRICLHDEFTVENPLISPCKCSGSMKTIHLACLQTWINSKLVTQNTGRPLSYYWKNMDCEVCKHQYPLAVNWIGPNAHLSKVESLGDPYIILETVDRDKNNSRSVYLLQFSNGDEFKLGRGHESDIKIHDISVSRCHAFISYAAGKFFIKDNQSKFGTLVQIPQNYEITDTLTIQAGRTLLTLSLENFNI